MKSVLPILAICSIFFISCNNVGNTSEVDSKDSTKKVQSVASGLEKITRKSAFKDMICQDWENSSDAEDVSASGGGSDLELPYRGYSFFSDGTVLKNPRDLIRFGTYTLDEKKQQISIVYEGKSKELLNVVAISPTNMLIKKNKEESIKYQSDGWKESTPALNPFYGANNRWRIAPVRSESDSLVKERAMACARFYQLFMDDHARRKSAVIQFAGLPSCFNWYRGGITVTGQKKLSPQFIRCFYNVDQANKAQAILEKAITKKYTWNREETSFVKQWSDVMRQYVDTLKGLSIPK